MKVYCGTDIIEIERIKNSIENLGEKFVNKIFTKNEIEYCNSHKNVKYQHYAARFAAKEAVFKAISPLLKDKYEIGWKNIEVLNDSNGRPYIKFIDFSFERLEQIDVSISHCKEYAVANVIII